MGPDVENYTNGLSPVTSKKYALPLVDCEACCTKNVATPWLQKHPHEESTILVRQCPICELAYAQTL
jgi:hypothetical protein